MPYEERAPEPDDSGISDDDVRRIAEAVHRRVLSDWKSRSSKLLRVDEVALRLGVHPNTVRNLVHDGAFVLTHVTPRAVRISSEQVERFIREKTSR